MSYKKESLQLPHDVIIEILLWLPPEHLLKFKGVCKLWYSTISHTKFIAKYRSQFDNFIRDKNIIIFLPKMPCSTSYNLRIHWNSDPAVIQDYTDLISQHKPNLGLIYYSVMGICNGLFCYANSRVRDDAYGIQLCNPCLRWATTIPPICFTNNTRYDLYYGVGYDRFSNDYKVIKFTPTIESPGFTPGDFAIYSVKAKKWEILKVGVPSHLPFGKSIFLRGNIHWLACSADLGFRIDMIVLFDVCNNVFGKIDLPEMEDLGYNMTSISVVKGSICLLVTKRCADKRIICQVWTMKEYGVVESWTRQCTVLLRNEIKVCIEVTPCGKIMCTASDRHVYECRSMNLPYIWTMVLYDTETDEYRNMGEEDLANRPAFSLEASFELLDESMGFHTKCTRKDLHNRCGTGFSTSSINPIVS